MINISDRVPPNLLKLYNVYYEYLRLPGICYQFQVKFSSVMDYLVSLPISFPVSSPLIMVPNIQADTNFPSVASITI